MDSIILKRDDLGTVTVYSDETKFFEAYQNLFNAINEGDSVSFNTFNKNKISNSIFLIKKYDIWGSKDSEEIIGNAGSLTKAKSLLGVDTDKWKEDEFYENGTNQWKSDKREILISVEEVSFESVDEF